MAENAPPLSSPTAAQALRQRQAERRRLMEQQAASRRAGSTSAQTPPPPPPPAEQPSSEPPSTASSLSLPGTSREPGISLPLNPPPPIQTSPQIPTDPAPSHITISSTLSSADQTPHKEREPRLLSTQLSSQEQDIFGPPNLGPKEWAIGLPLSEVEIVEGGGSSQKSIHLHYINQRHQEIERFLSEGKNADRVTVFEMIHKIARITVHPNLAFPLPDTQATDEQWAQLHIRSSSKFKFLHDLVEALSEDSVKIGIIAQESTLIDMLETLFRGMKVQYKRCDRPSKLAPLPDDQIESMVSVFIVPSKNSGAVGNSCNIVIAMDSFFDAEEVEVKQMRRDLLEPGKEAPVIRLISLNTIEHALLCADAEKDFFMPCVEVIKLLRNDAGYADAPYMAAIKEAVSKISNWVRNRCNGSLDIPALPELSLFEPVPANHLSSSQLPSTQAESVSVPPPPPPPPPMSPDNGEKRKRRESLINPIADPKKLKLDETHAEPGDITHVSDTIIGESTQKEQAADIADITHITNTQPGQYQLLPAQQLSQLEPEPAPSSPPKRSPPPAEPESSEPMMDLDTSSSPSSSSSSSPSRSPSPISPTIQRARPIALPPPETLDTLPHAELLTRLLTTTETLNSYIASTSRLASRYESLRSESIALKSQVTTLTSTSSQLRASLSRAETTKSTLSTKHAETLSSLAEARNSLLKGTIPQQRLVELTLAEESLTSQVAELTKRLEQKELELSFTREQYQAASNATYAIRRDLEALEADKEALKRKADERTIRLLEVRKTRGDQEKEREIEELKRRLKESEERCRRLEEEKKGRINGGRYARTGSVPRRGSPSVSRASSPATAGKFGWQI